MGLLKPRQRKSGKVKCNIALHLFSYAKRENLEVEARCQAATMPDREDRRSVPDGGIAKSACKPGSVRNPSGFRGSHSSGTVIAHGLKQPTRERRGPRHRPPIWSCTGWGLPTPDVAAGVVRSYRRCASPHHPHVHRRTALFHPCRGPLEALPFLRRPRRTPRGPPGLPPVAVYFLLHFPSPHDARPLAGILLYGARTFLHGLSPTAAAWRTSGHHCRRLLAV